MYFFSSQGEKIAKSRYTEQEAIQKGRPMWYKKNSGTGWVGSDQKKKYHG